MRMAKGCWQHPSDIAALPYRTTEITAFGKRLTSIILLNFLGDTNYEDIACCRSNV